MKQYELRDIEGNILGDAAFSDLEEGTTGSTFSILVANTGDEASSDLRLTVILADRTFGSGANLDGFEVMTERWVEARIGAGAWTPIGGNPVDAGNYLSVPSPDPGDSVQVDLRWNIPAGIETKGDVICSLELFFKVEE